MFSTYYITIFLKGKTHEKVLILSIAPPPPRIRIWILGKGIFLDAKLV